MVVSEDHDEWRAHKRPWIEEAFVKVFCQPNPLWQLAFGRAEELLRKAWKRFSSGYRDG
jgi:hypothetical protein